MFPGFVSIYKDKDKFIHLYFFQGIDENNKPIYHNIDLSDCQFKYKEHINIDNSIEYIFENKSIVRISCKLVDKNNKIHIQTLSLK